MTPVEIARAFGCSTDTARDMLDARPGEVLYAVWELGPIRCYLQGRNWALDGRRVQAPAILAAWNRMKARRRRAA
jgi:hypothetical protein